MILTNTKRVIAGVSLMALAACNPTMQGDDLQKTRQGAMIGAAAGAVIGGTRESGSDRLENALKGAVVGGLAGAAVGNILDNQARELEQNLDSDIDVINTGEELIVRMPQDILFAVDSTAVRGDLRADLFTLADSLRRYPNSVVTIVGHTDSTGDASYNQDLSERRARSVANVLIDAGVRSSRLRTFGAGESQPIATNQTASGRALNRRVDITITPTN